MLISLIAAVDEHWGIGKNNQLLCRLPADLKHFKELTLGKTVIMGRKTFDSIGKPLVNRENIIISRQKIDVDNALVVSSLETALDSVTTQEAVIIGGASVYEQSIKYLNQLYLTFIHHHFTADVFFPKINFDEWRCLGETFRQRDKSNPYDMTFKYYCLSKDFDEKAQPLLALN